MQADEIAATAARLREQIARVVMGQDQGVELLFAAWLAGGHVLLEGVPGTAKTLLARALARSLQLRFARLQFTPDLMPADVLGTSLFDFQTGRFALQKGPIFTELLLADEINRTPPKTQSALLEAMQERSVTLDGSTHALGETFFVVATQNPIEQEGTYPLPEAQLDRFLLKLRIGYPERADERRMAAVHGRTVPDLDGFGLEPLVGREFLQAARAAVAAVRLEDPVLDYLLDVVRATREHAAVRCGASPRAVNMLAAAARALAAVQGMDFVLPDHVQQLAVPLLAHRVVLTPAAEIEGADAGGVVQQILAGIKAPR
ncbi:MAG: MoxR family ATPase [Planctomycetes bacterium]|nr:MoxR family ATPase [Planctomycetota bacterium]